MKSRDPHGTQIGIRERATRGRKIVQTSKAAYKVRRIFQGIGGVSKRKIAIAIHTEAVKFEEVTNVRHVRYGLLCQESWRADIYSPTLGLFIRPYKF